MPTTFTHPDLSAAAAADVLRAAGFEVDPPRVSYRVLLDTFDGRLHAAGLRLELRAEPDAALVLIDGNGAPPARLAWRSVLRWPADLPAGPFRARVADLTEERALLPLVTITSHVSEARRLDRRGKVVARAEVHEQVAADGDVVAEWLVEVTGVVGHDDERERSLTRLAAVGMESVDADVATAAATAAGHDLRGRTSSPTVPLKRREPALDGFRRVLANLADTIDDNLLGTIDDVDVEFLHELRVAVRRTRSVLAEGKGVLPADVRRRYRESFGWLGQITGAARDLDVYVIGWDDYTAPLSTVNRGSLDRVLAELEKRRRAAHAELARALRSDECGELLDSWRAWLTDPDVDAGPTIVASGRSWPTASPAPSARSSPTGGPSRPPRRPSASTTCARTRRSSATCSSASAASSRPRAARPSSPSSRRSRTTSVRTRTPRCTWPSSASWPTTCTLGRPSTPTRCSPWGA